MSDGFTVRAGELAAGGKNVSSLSGTGEKIGAGVTKAISGMGEAAGHAGLAGALMGAAEQGMKTFLDIAAAFEHTSSSLAATAESYGQAEEENTSKARSARGGAR